MPWAVLLAVCSPAARGVATPDDATFASVLQVTDTVVLRERSEVITVSPRISFDTDGGYIVADPSENQVRLYQRTGHLTGFFGRRGKGPGEFDRLTRALRNSDGSVLAVDMGGRLTIFDSVGARVLGTESLPLFPVYDMALVDDSIVAVTGRVQGRADSPLVHLWDVRNARLVRSFFQRPAPSARFVSAYTFAGGADIAVRGDTAAVVFALSDTVHLFLLNGTPLARHAVRSHVFRHLAAPMPDDPSTRALQRWMESFSTVNQVFWGADGNLYLQFFDLRGYDRAWSIASLSSRGEKRFELSNAPMLLAVGDADSSFVFARPGSEAPNELAIARVRP